MSSLTIHATGLSISDEDIAKLRDKCGPAKKMIAIIEAEAFRRAEENPELWRKLGYEIREGVGKRAVDDIATVGERLNARGVEWPDITAACTITIGAVEKLTRAATSKKGVGLKKECDAILDGCCAIKKAKASLRRIGELEDDE